MDLNTVSAVVSLRERSDINKWKPGSTWLAGGSWLFSEPQTSVDTLLDLSGFDWPPISIFDDKVEIAATCTFGQLYAATWPKDFIGASLVGPCCRALLGSFKIWNVATVGGNICLALPAGPMSAFATALDGIGVVWAPGGSDRRIPIKDFVTGVTKTALKPGEILRAIELPVSALRRHGATRRISLSVGGRSAAFLIGMRDGDAFFLTITGATRRPMRVDFATRPTSSVLLSAIDALLPPDAYYDDIHGRPDWRRHVTRRLAGELLDELFAR